MKDKSSAYNRNISRRKALRKRRIAKEICGFSYYNNLHQYSKNKIHCSCPMCSGKTRNKGRRRMRSGNYAPSLNYKISDLRRQVTMDDDELESIGKILKPVKRRRRW